MNSQPRVITRARRG